MLHKSHTYMHSHTHTHNTHTHTHTYTQLLELVARLRRSVAALLQRRLTRARLPGLPAQNQPDTVQEATPALEPGGSEAAAAAAAAAAAKPSPPPPLTAPLSSPPAVAAPSSSAAENGGLGLRNPGRFEDDDDRPELPPGVSDPGSLAKTALAAGLPVEVKVNEFVHGCLLQ